MEHSLKGAVASVLRPLVRYLIGQGVTYPGLCALLKTVYVQEAEHFAPIEGAVVTDSRVALLSGVHRKEVSRLRTQPDTLLSPSRAASIAARVVAEWASAPSYIDADGHPRALPLKDVGGPSFEGLVRRVKADLRANVIIEELVRVGVAVQEGGLVRLKRTAYVSDLPQEKLHFLGANVGDHLASATHNLEAPDDPFIERAVYYNGIPAAYMPDLRSRLFQTADRFIREANQMIMPLDDEQTEGHHKRVRLGVFYFEEESGPIAKAKGARSS
ncbi:MAG: DUF6502 family protein [Acidiferrobacteraceae bacterium]